MFVMHIFWSGVDPLIMKRESFSEFVSNPSSLALSAADRRPLVAVVAVSVDLMIRSQVLQVPAVPL